MHSNDCESSGTTRPTRLRRWSLICLIALVAGIAGWSYINRENESSPPKAAMTPNPRAGKTDRPSAANATSGLPEILIPQAEESAGAIPTPAAHYDTEDFTHVPNWIPRPVNARAASAEDASLRSDGVVEGTVRLEFGSEIPDALQSVATHLEMAGMLPDASGTIFSSEDPPRRCEVETSSAAGGGIKVSIAYQGIDHEKGCRCPTCGGTPENPEP